MMSNVYCLTIGDYLTLTVMAAIVMFFYLYNRRSLPNIDRYGSSFAGEPLTLPPGGNGRLYGITSVESQCPAGE